MVIGVDLGGTKVAAASLRERELGSPVIQPTDRSAPAALLDQVVALVREVQRDGPVQAVGIGVASVVDFETGCVVSSVNLPLAHLPLRKLLGERLGLPVFVDNDATVSALAEAHDQEPEVVIGGGGAQAGELLLEAARRMALAYVLPGVGRRTTIRLARHGVRAGVLGAALLALHELVQ